MIASVKNIWKRKVVKSYLGPVLPQRPRLGVGNQGLGPYIDLFFSRLGAPQELHLSPGTFDPQYSQLAAVEPMARMSSLMSALVKSINLSLKTPNPPVY